MAPDGINAKQMWHRIAFGIADETDKLLMLYR
jgi:hypothetical protein